MVELLKNLKRTNMCGELTKQMVGQKVVLMGWAARRRDLGGLIFIQLRDRTGISQVVFDSDSTDKRLFEKASLIKQEYVIAVEGQVELRTENNINANMSTGEVEVVATQLLILSEAETPPFAIGSTQAGELLRLKYRYLDLRRKEIQDTLITRSKIAQIAREYLASKSFIEIETPILGKSSPEGAKEYLVPSRVHPGAFYALPQSPQQFKQLLMIAGLDRYYQIARCFRDEDLRANRQPEFTQIDIEMSFIDDENDLMTIMEGLIGNIFREIKGLELKTPFRRLKYNDAMSMYGSDKPDLRFEMKITDISKLTANSGFSLFDNAVNQGGSVRAIVLNDFEDKLSRKELDKLIDFVKTYRAKSLLWHGVGKDGVRSSFAKAVTPELSNSILKTLNVKSGDIAFIVADSDNDVVFNSLGALRCELAERFNLIDKSKYEILWIVDFPLFEYDHEAQRFVAKHHPFTSPKNEDVEFIKTAPQNCRAKAYDLVINGQEAGGGSLRIYNRELQETMFQALGFTPEMIKQKFGYFVDAFRYGTPPHGGIAFGLDRLTMLLTGNESIKDVIAFPKIQNASCLMTDSPSEVDEDLLKDLEIAHHKYE